MIKPSPRLECRCPQCTGTLFHLPEPGRSQKPLKTPHARYTRFKPKVRILCDDCIADIHQRGVAVAPLPQPVRWRRTDAAGITHLCQRHKDIRTEQECE